MSEPDPFETDLDPLAELEEPPDCDAIGGRLSDAEAQRLRALQKDRTLYLTAGSEARDGEPSALEQARGRLVVGDAILDLPTPVALVGNALQQDSTAVLFGRGGVGKTYIATDIALHVARGDWWHGRAVAQGPVLYVIAEGAHVLPGRLRAWLRHHQLNTIGPITWYPHAVNLLHRDEVGVLIEIARELAPVLVVIDTLARCMVGGDENSAKDMGLVVDSLTRLQRATTACVLSLHHSGKDETAGARGSSALYGAIDTEIEVRGDPDNLAVTIRKQRNGPDGPLGRFHLEPVSDSRVLAPHGRPTTDLRDSATLAMVETLHAIDTGSGVANSTWNGVTDVGTRTFHRRLKNLLDLDMVTNVGTTHGPATALRHKASRSPLCQVTHDCQTVPRHEPNGDCHHRGPRGPGWCHQRPRPPTRK